MGMVQILGIIILLVGIVLIGIEFYMPGFGLPGIFGMISTIVGIYMAGKNITERIITGIIAVVIIVVMLVISIVLFKSQKVKAPIKLDTDLQGKNLFIDETDMEYLIGKNGTAITDLRPSGKGEFDGVKLDVLSGGEFIEKGKALVIKEIKNNKIFVEERRGN